MSFAALTVDINARTANLESGIDRLKAKTSGLDEFGKKLGLSLAGLGGVAAAAGAGMVALARQVADLQDSASKMSQRIGIGVEALNELQYAASLADVDTELLANAMTRLSIRISEAISGNKESAAIFDTLGIAIKDASGQARSADEVFADVADRFQQFEDGTNKTAQAAELFGTKIGGRMLPLLNAGSKGLREAAAEARAYGLVFSTEAAQNAEAFNDHLTRLQAQLTGLKIELASGVIPVLTQFLETFNLARAEGKGFWEALKLLPGPGADIDFQIKNTTEELGKLRQELKDIESGKNWGIGIFGGDRKKKVEENIASLEKELDFYQRRKAMLAGDDGFVGPPRPRTSAPPVPETSGGGANKEAQAAEKFLQSLRQQLYATQDLTAEQQLYLRLQEDKLKLTPLELEQAVALARQTDVLRKANELKKDEAGLDALISGSQQRHQDSLIALGQQYDDMVNPMNKYLRKLEEIELLEKEGIIGAGVAQKAKLQLKKDIEKATEDAGDPLREIKDQADELGWAFSSSFEKAALSGEKLSTVLHGLLSDLGKILLRRLILEPIASGISGALVPKAIGGPVNAGGSYLVGEQGPERFTPAVDGYITPNKDLRSGGVAVHQTLVFNRGVTRGELLAASQTATDRAKRDIYESMRRNGVFANV